MHKTKVVDRTGMDMEYHIYFEAYRPIEYNDYCETPTPEHWKEDKHWTAEEIEEECLEDLMSDTFTCDSIEELEEDFKKYVEQMETQGFCTFKKIYAKRMWCCPAWGNEQLNTDLEWTKN